MNITQIVPPAFTDLAHLLQWRGQQIPTENAYLFLHADETLSPDRLTYAQLHDQALHIAAALQRLEARDKPVLLCYEPGLAYIAAFFGCLYAGAIAVPAYPPDPLRPQRMMPRLQAIVENAQADIVLTTTNLLAEVRTYLHQSSRELHILDTDAILTSDGEVETIASLTPAQLAFLMYTSGSTGKPKGVMVTHGNVMHNLSRFPGFQERPCHAIVSWLPLFHDLGLLLGVLHPLYQGKPGILMNPATFARHPYRWLKAISDYQATTTGGPNFAYDLCVARIKPEERAQLDLSHWNLALNGAEPVRHETLQQFAKVFAPCGYRPETAYPSYGMAEGTATVTGPADFAPPFALTLDRQALARRKIVLNQPDATSVTLVSCGPVMPDEDICIVNPDTLTPCPPHEVGEIWVSGPSIAQGYWQRAADTDRDFKAQLAEPNGRFYLRTGDLGFVHEGNLFIAGRLKDVIIIRGVNHYPEDIEQTIAHCHPAVRPGGGAAFAVETNGQEQLVLLQEVNPKRMSDPEPVFAHIRQVLAEAHDIHANAIVLIKPGTLLKTSSGKIRRRANRDAFLTNDLETIAYWQMPAASAEESASDVITPLDVNPPAAAAQTIRRWLQTYFGQRNNLPPAQIDTHMPFAAYGLGSLEALTLIQELEQWLGRPLTATLAWNYPTIDALASHLAEDTNLAAQALAIQETRPQTQEPIAIIGMSCRFPGGADSPDALWQLLAQGADTVTEIGADRWPINDYYHPQRETRGKMVSRWGSHLTDLDQFDAAFFGISPREAAQLDPRQRLLLEGAWEALEDAGIPADSLAGSHTGVFIGVLQDDYGERVFDDYTIVNAYSGSGTANAPVANRISYFFDFHGPSLVIDTACSGSLVAIHQACHSLRSGETTVALAGGVNIILEPDSDLFMSQAGIISEDGRCKTFDSRANGIVRAEGMGLLVLKPLSQALVDGDRVHAVIRGSAVNHDGRSNGLMAPNGQAQEQLLCAAQANAGVQPPQMQYIEAHGTATKLGDPIEVAAIGTVLSDYPTHTYCALGSIKSNIGHAEAAAGIAGVIKVVMAMKKGQLPPNLHFHEPNPLIPFDRLPLRVQEMLGPWPRPDQPLIAGVSGFGFSGTNGHVILEAAATAVSPPKAPIPSSALPLVLLPLSAKTPTALRQLAQRYQTYLQKNGSDLIAVSSAAALRRSHLPQRLALVGDTQAALLTQLQAFMESGEREAETAVLSPSPLVFVFSGQGTQWLGMGQTLYAQEPVFRATLDACDAILQPIAGWSLLAELNAPPETSRLDDTLVAQVAIFAMQVALAALWHSWGIIPAAIVGQSLGEVAAAHAAGALSLEDALRVVFHRSRVMQQVEGKGLTAVLGLPLAEAKLVTLAFQDVVAVAGSSSPTTSLISGEPEAVQRVVKAVETQGAFAQLVRGVNIAFHSAQMDPLIMELITSLTDIHPRPTSIPLFSTVTGTLIDGTSLDAAYWGRNLREPFVFTQVMAQLIQSGYQTYLEVSPHPVLTGAIRQGLQALDQEGVALPSLRRDEQEKKGLLTTLGHLYTAGYTVYWQRLYPDSVPFVSLPTYPWQKEHYWLEQIGWTPLTEQLARKRNTSHPLLGQYTQTAVFPHQHIWEMDLDDQTIPYFNDHQVQELVVLPGAAYAEMALAAAQQVWGNDGVELEQLTFVQGLILSERPLRIQAVLTPEIANVATFQVFSRDFTATDWRLNAEVTLHRSGEMAPLPPTLNLAALQEIYSEAITGAAHVQAMRRRGLAYGPAFQAVRHIWRRDGEALAHLQIDKTLTIGLDAYTVHPTLLDAASQTVAAAMNSSHSETAIFLPAAIERLRFWQAVGADVWCHTHLLHTADVDERTADITLTNAEGHVLATITGLRLQRVAPPQTERMIDRWSYQVKWQPQPLPSADKMHTQPGSWLIFTETSQGEALAERLRLEGHTPVLVRRSSAAYHTTSHAAQVEYWLNPAEPDHYRRLLADALSVDQPPCRGIVHMWSQNLIPGEFSRDEMGSVDTVLLLVQALADASLSAQPRLWLLTHQAQAVIPEEPVNPMGAPLWGMGRVLANEHPELRTMLVDLEANTPIDELLAELQAKASETNASENQVALRPDGRYVARLARFMVAERPFTSPPVIISRTAPYRLQAVTPGVLDSLTLQAQKRRQPGVGEVEVEMAAAGLNFKDVMLALGMLPPLPDGTVPLGLEGAGRVTAVGPQVSRVQVGDEVLVGGDNCFSRYVITAEHLVGLKPKALSMAEAASLLVAFGTSHYALNRLGQIRSGERVLIHTASGAVGQAAVQLARLAGAEIYATAGTPEKRAFLREQMKVAHVFDSRTLSFASEIMTLTNGEGIDIVLNTLSGAGIAKSLALLRPHGRFLELGKRDIVANNPLRLGALEKNIAYFVIDFNQMMRDRPQLVGELIDNEILSLFANGRLQPIVSHTFPITEAADAFQLMAQAKHIGKVVLSLADLDVPIVPAGTPEMEILPDATYLITGGMGGIGRTVAEYLVRCGARHLVLTSRRDRAALPPDKASFLAALDAAGVEVVVAQSDVAEAHDVIALMADMRANMPPLRGIIHSAGVVEDGLLLGLQPPQLQRVLAPKVRGAWYLHQYSQEAPLDFFVLFSSLAALLGPQGQANYAAGNAFMDALAHYRRAHGLPALSINWGAWAEVGMAARQNLATQHAAGGVQAMSPPEAIAALAQLWTQPLAQVTIADIDWLHMRQAIPDTVYVPFITDLLAEEGAITAEKTAVSDFVQQVLQAAPVNERASLLEAHLQQLAASVFHLEPSRLNRRVPFTDLGIDSIMAMELKTKIEKSVGAVSLSVVDLLRQTSITSLAAQLLPRLVLDEIEAAEVADVLLEANNLSATELDALLASMA